MALGAITTDVLKLILRDGLKLVAVGVTIGWVASLALVHFLSSYLYGVPRYDVLTFVSVAWLLVSVSLLACYIPARRATKVDPMRALRSE
jgi:ABC-type antimicrobial peptide transport system permease subunit